MSVGLRSPIGRFGGKGMLAARLVAMRPLDYRAYVEPYFGGGSVFFKLPRGHADIETINDIDHAVMDFYRIVQAQGSFERFLDLARTTLHCRELWQECRASWQLEADPVVRAWRWWVVARQSYANDWGNSWQSDIQHRRRAMAGTCSALLGAINALPLVHQRLQGVQIECWDALRVIERYGIAKAWVYCDPPYVESTRRNGVYLHEMTDQQHRDLVGVLLDNPAMVMVSGYKHPIYHDLEAAGWRRHEIPTSAWSAPRTAATGIKGDGSAGAMAARVEIIWTNYEPAGARRLLEVPR